MEHTNYVARAKALMMKTARTTALVIVPLAAAVSAHAGAIVASGAVLPTSNLTCTRVDGFGTGGCTMNDLQQTSQSGITGLSFYTGTGAVGFNLSGSSTAIQLKVGAGGPLSGNLTQNDPVAFSFNFNLQSGGSVSSWSILMAFGNAFGDSSYGSFGASGSGGSGSFIPESGSGTLVIPSGGIASGSTFWETTTINATISGGINLQINVPGGATFDYNSAAASSVPEPGSVGLLGSGLAFLGYLFRRRRRKA
jgi:hypothetical protein